MVDEALKKRLVDGGMDDLLATHFAHLFIRDPIVVFEHDLEKLDLEGVDHFENLQSTNWQHMRFKPPPPGNGTGWRVEFRPMEIQITDFENAAFAVFIVLVTRAILSFDLNFYLPIARTTENMMTAHARDAVLNKKFWFRKDPLSAASIRRSPNTSAPGSRRGSPGPPTNGDHEEVPLGPVEDEYCQMTVDEIINGQQTSSSSDETLFPGLIPLVESYLDSVNVDVETRCDLARYLDLIRRRANGRLQTGAKWMREFVMKHPEYKHDSMVSSSVAYDLCKMVGEVTKKERAAAEAWPLLGKRSS